MELEVGVERKNVLGESLLFPLNCSENEKHSCYKLVWKCFINPRDGQFSLTMSKPCNPLKEVTMSSISSQTQKLAEVCRQTLTSPEHVDMAAEEADRLRINP